jgi:hypothetical protein
VEAFVAARRTWNPRTIEPVSSWNYGTLERAALAIRLSAMKTDPKMTAARAFIRSLNILLKLARLYGFGHVRTNVQLDTAWQELCAALAAGTEAGLLLGATGQQLLLDGIPLEGSPPERQFAQMLSSAGLASVQFFPTITREELQSFVEAFPTGKAKSSELAEQLKAAMAGARGVHINEICFVATDSRYREAHIAAELAAGALGQGSSQFKQWLNDPQKLLELIVAAQGMKAGGAGSEGGGSAGNGPGTSGMVSPGAASGDSSTAVARLAAGAAGEPSEADMLGVLRMLTSLGQAGSGGIGGVAPGPLQEHLSKLPGSACSVLQQALASMAAQAQNKKPDESVLVRLAEHLAIRFALERYERGEVKVNAVRELLERMDKEIAELRKILGSHEEKMAEAGLVVETHGDILDRMFWAAVPESGKRAVLTSAEAWCVPPRNVRQYVAELIERGEMGKAMEILKNYAACAGNEEADARRKTAVGLAELAELYAQGDGPLLSEAIKQIGLRLSVERDAELQGVVNAAFVRLSQEAAAHRCFAAMKQSLEAVSAVENQRPGVALSLRPKIGVEERVPEFLEEALRARRVAAGLTDVLRMVPRTASEQMAARFNRCSLREDCEHLVALAQAIGPEAAAPLLDCLRAGPAAEAAEVVGLLTRLDPAAVETLLSARIHEFSRTLQDRIVRQVAASGGAARSRILWAVLDGLDPLVMPLAVDEIGMACDREALGRLLLMADGDLPARGGSFLRVKAVEALGRLRSPAAVKLLQRILESRHRWRWANPQELRIAAAQVLAKLDPQRLADFLPHSGLSEQDLALPPLDAEPNSRWVRQRRHPRVRLTRVLPAVTTNLKENCRLEIKTVSLTGGVAKLDRHLQPGTQVQLKLGSGMRGILATALMRDYRAQDMAFEIVDMNLDERSRLRRFLVDNLPPTVEAGGPPDSAQVAAVAS